MRNPSDKISQEQAKEALSRSGYLIESRLEMVLRDNDYYVEANSAYQDPLTDKSRELDLYAMSAHRAGQDEWDFIFGVLLIECLNNPQPVAFITKEPQVAFLHHHEVKLSGLPVKITPRTSSHSWTTLPGYLEMDKYHHYCKGRIATQFCSFAKKKQQDEEWMATHEPVFDPFLNLCVATEYFIDRHFTSWRFDEHETVNVEFYYPVVVIQGELLDVHQTSAELGLIEADHIQYRRSAIVDGKEIVYHIDVVTERFFPEYLAIIRLELSKTARLLRRRHETVRESIARIARSARRLRSPEKIRAAMEF